MLDFLENLKNISWAGNTLYDYVRATALFLGLLVGLRLAQLIVVSRLRRLAEKTVNDFDDVLIEIFVKLRPPFYFLVPLYFAVYTLTMGDVTSTIVKFAFLTTVVYEAISAAGRLVNYFVGKRFAGDGEDDNTRQAKTTANAIRMVVQVALWVIGLIVILSNLGVNVNSLIASLGIGGLAVALALQNILSDLFSSFTIFFDKPFVIGDFIQAGTDMGTVEKIGLKTTRLRTLTGQALLVPNRDLVGARVHNYKRMTRRRGVTNLGIEYGTPHGSLAQLPELVKRIVDAADGVDFDRCHFVGYGDSSLNFEVVYYVDSPDYAVFLDRQQKIYLDIYKEFEAAGLNFAFPTRTIHTKAG